MSKKSTAKRTISNTRVLPDLLAAIEAMRSAWRNGESYTDHKAAQQMTRAVKRLLAAQRRFSARSKNDLSQNRPKPHSQPTA